MHTAFLRLLAAAALLLSSPVFADTRHSRIVYPGDDGCLVYVPDSLGNVIPDFSHAGYRGGHAPIPDVPTRVTVEPREGDDGHAIQAAIDEDEQHAWTFIEFDQVRNGWVREVSSYHFGYALVSTRNNTKWISAQDCESYDPVSRVNGGRRYSFSMRGELHLVQNAFARNGRHDFAVGTRASSGTVFQNCVSDRIHASNEPHHRYSTGILYDNVTHTNPQTPMVLGLWNRGSHGTGHGWAAANSVLWNCEALDAGIVCEKPPLAQNYAIGVRSAWMSGAYRFGPNTGRHTTLEPMGAHWEHWNTEPVAPTSLSKAQLRDRLGR